MKLNLQMFAAPGSTSALREETFDRLQLNCGIFIKNFDYDALLDADDVLAAIDDEIQLGTNLLGVTYGGGTFNVSRDMRTPQIDGLRYRFKGGNFVDSTDPYMTTTLKECTPANFATALGAELTTSGKKSTIKMPTAIQETAYIDNLCWVGDLSNGDVVLIRLDNALNTANFTFTFTDKGEGSFAVEFHACQASVLDYDYAPFEVIFFGSEESADLTHITVTSAAGTGSGDTAITIDYEPDTGESLIYKIGSPAPSVGYHQTMDYSWTAWDGDDEIAAGTGANGKKITIAAINGDGKAVAAGSTTLVVKTT